MTTLRLRESQLQQHSNMNQEMKELLNEKDKLVHALRYISTNTSRGTLLICGRWFSLYVSRSERTCTFRVTLTALLKLSTLVWYVKPSPLSLFFPILFHCEDSLILKNCGSPRNNSMLPYYKIAACFYEFINLDGNWETNRYYISVIVIDKSFMS